MKKSKKGFILFEAIISVIIVSLLLTVFLSMYLSINKKNRNLEHEYNLARTISNTCNEIICNPNNYINKEYIYINDDGLLAYEKKANYLKINSSKDGHYTHIKLKLYLNEKLSPILLDGENKLYELSVRVYG